MSRQSIIDNSACMIGRNIYSQSLRTYALEPYKDGNYYSDCSSFATAAFKAGGYNINWNNSSSFKTDPAFETIPCQQDGKHLINPASVLKVADVIVWDGHCEMVHHIDGDTVYLQGHGADTPSIKELYRAESWNSGNIVIRRLKALNDEVETPNTEQLVEAPKVKEPLYKVQTGAFSDDETAKQHMAELSLKGFDSYILRKNGMVTVQAGAFKNQVNATNLAELLRNSNFNAYVWLDE